MNHEDIQGWFDFEEFYTYVAQAVPNGATCVELGPWLGKSTIHLAEQLKLLGKKVKLFAVDTWGGSPGEDVFQVVAGGLKAGPYEEFLENVKKYSVEDIVVPHRKNSIEAASDFGTESVHFLFHDTAHDYKHVFNELRAWAPKAKVGAIVGGHDYAMEEVRKAVDEFWGSVKQYGPCWWTIKT